MSIEEHTGELEVDLFGAVALYSFLIQKIRDAVALGQALAKEGIQSVAVRDSIRHPLDAKPEIAKGPAIVGQALSKQEGVQGAAVKDQIPHPLDAEPEIAKRRAIVRQNPKLSGREFCKLFDLESVPLPRDWGGEYRVNDWKAAYANPKSRRHVLPLISKDKKLAVQRAV